MIINYRPKYTYVKSERENVIIMIFYISRYTA